MEQKKKNKYITVGSVMNPKPGSDNKKPYIRLDGYNAETLAKVLVNTPKNKGVFLNLQTRAEQIEGVKKAMTNGKLSEEIGEKIISRLEKYKDSVKFDLVLTVEE